MNEEFVIIKYHDNFADNLSSYAYAKIIEKDCEIKCYYENKTNLREIFEEKMNYFDLDLNYLSSAKVNNIATKANNFNKIILDKNYKKKKIKKGFIEQKHFNISDTKLIFEDISNSFDFKSKDFIVNHDILEEIIQCNSIGVYLDIQDIENNQIDYEFIKKAAKRLNKYVKQPKLFIFAKTNINNLELCMNYKHLNLKDWKEEFYFLKSCKHKIILNSPNSYSNGFWAAFLNEKDYFYNIYDKKLKVKDAKHNWIGI